MRRSTIALLALALTTLALPAEGQRGRRRGPGYHVLVHSAVDNSGKQTQTDVLLQTPHVVLSRVVLRRGARLATHAAPWAITIQVLGGSGTLKLDGGKRELLHKSRLLFLAPGMRHSVDAFAKEPLVLLVHQLKQSGGGGYGYRGGMR
ncbi:MAG: hypothetical protein KC503_11405 [Myxococcales bacterium]|nr:hypothetical protein [Myxococcales bacterium]